MARWYDPADMQGFDDFRRELLERGRGMVAALWLVGAVVGFSNLAMTVPQWYRVPQVWLLFVVAVVGTVLSLKMRVDRLGLDGVLVPLSLLAMLAATVAAGFVAGLRPQFLLVYGLVAALAGLTPSSFTAAAIAAAAGVVPLALLVYYPRPQLAEYLAFQLPLQTIIAILSFRITQYMTRDRQEKRHLAAVAQTSRILTSLDPDALLEATADHLLGVTHSAVCFISVLERPGNELVNKIVRYVPGSYSQEEFEAVKRLRFKVGEGLTGWVAAHGQPLLCGNPFDDPRAKQIPGTQRVDESIVAVPFYAQGEVAGVIRISRPGLYQYTTEDLQLAEILANHVSVALEKAHLYQKARHLAVTDDLTGLGNARHMEDRLVQEVARARRYGRPLSLVLIDSDSLKKVNDQFGHLQGNELLKAMADAIRASIRSTDIAFRYAGDEFVVLMPETGAAAAATAAERIRSAIEKHGLLVDGTFVSVTASVGVATFPDHAVDAEDLVRKADMAMYVAKARGKNRVELSGIGA